MPAAESELLRAFREAFEQGNRAWNAGDVRTAYAGLPDQLEYRLAPAWPEARVLRSRDEVIEFFEDFQHTFPDARTTSHEYLEGSHGTVIAGFRVAGTGRSSGVGGEMRIWQVWEVRKQDNFTVTRVTEFMNRRDALEAAGLKEWAMSEENVELVRRGIRSVEAFWALLDEHITWDLGEKPPPDFHKTYVGRDAVIAASRRYWGTWEDYTLDADELIEAGSSVVVVVHERGRGKGSGAPFDRHWAQVWTFREGRIVRWELFPGKAEALQAAGLSE